jgi:hypothetical protein
MGPTERDESEYRGATNTVLGWWKCVVLGGLFIGVQCGASIKPIAFLEPAHGHKGIANLTCNSHCFKTT